MTLFPLSSLSTASSFARGPSSVGGVPWVADFPGRTGFTKLAVFLGWRISLGARVPPSWRRSLGGGSLWEQGFHQAGGFLWVVDFSGRTGFTKLAVFPGGRLPWVDGFHQAGGFLWVVDFPGHQGFIKLGVFPGWLISLGARVSPSWRCSLGGGFPWAPGFHQAGGVSWVADVPGHQGSTKLAVFHGWRISLGTRVSPSWRCSQVSEVPQMPQESHVSWGGGELGKGDFNISVYVCLSVGGTVVDMCSPLSRGSSRGILPIPPGHAPASPGRASRAPASIPLGRPAGAATTPQRPRPPPPPLPSQEGRGGGGGSPRLTPHGSPSPMVPGTGGRVGIQHSPKRRYPELRVAWFGGDPGACRGGRGGKG